MVLLSGGADSQVQRWETSPNPVPNPNANAKPNANPDPNPNPNPNPNQVQRWEPSSRMNPFLYSVTDTYLGHKGAVLCALYCEEVRVTNPNPKPNLNSSPSPNPQP